MESEEKRTSEVLARSILSEIEKTAIQRSLRKSVKNVISRASACMRQQEWVGLFFTNPLNEFLNCLLNEPAFNKEGKVSNQLFKFRPLLKSVETTLDKSPKRFPTVFREMKEKLKEKYPKPASYTLFEKRARTGSIVFIQTLNPAPVQCVRDHKVKLFCPINAEIDLERKMVEAKRLVRSIEFTLKIAETMENAKKREIKTLLKTLAKIMSEDALWVLNSHPEIKREINSLKASIKSGLEYPEYENLRKKILKIEQRHMKKYEPWRKSEENFWYRFEPRLGPQTMQISDQLLLQKKHLIKVSQNKSTE